MPLDSMVSIFFKAIKENINRSDPIWTNHDLPPMANNPCNLYKTTGQFCFLTTSFL